MDPPEASLASEEAGGTAGDLVEPARQSALASAQ